VTSRPRSLSAALALILAAACAPAPGFDLIVRGGTLIDGSGSPPRVADVAVSGGRVVAIGPLPGATAEREIDASGLVVAPGFIDLHSHADLILLAAGREPERLLAAKISQGVTTVLVGNCGLGSAPSTAPAAEILSGVNAWMAPAGGAPGAMSIAGYLGRLARAGVPLNAGTLVPHGPVRISALGLERGPADARRLEDMREAVARGLGEGAFGLSVGLIYSPGMYSDTDELVALGQVVAAHGGLLAAHVRGSSETLLAATRELIEIARRSGARVHHSHLEAVGERFWPEARTVLELEDAARAAGLPVSHDVFPYTRAATMMAAIFPPWSLEGGVPALLERLERPELRARLRREIERQVPAWPPWNEGGWPHNLVEAVGWDGIRVASVGPDGPPDVVGRSLAEIGRATGRDPFDVVADLMAATRGDVGQLVAEISGDDGRDRVLETILAHPAGAIVSDAEDYGRGAPHPAHAGAFVRALRLNRERSLAPLEAFVHRMTGRPAALVGLGDRGIVREGAWADLVAFDPQTVTDRATWERPREPAVGVAWVVINGEVVVSGGRYLGGRPGRVLYARSADGAAAGR